MEKTINIDGKEVRLRATAAVPRLYRIKFGRDIMQDLSKLSDAYEKATTEQEQFEATDLGRPAWKNGWIPSRCSASIKSCRKF